MTKTQGRSGARKCKKGGGKHLLKGDGSNASSVPRILDSKCDKSIQETNIPDFDLNTLTTAEQKGITQANKENVNPQNTEASSAERQPKGRPQKIPDIPSAKPRRSARLNPSIPDPPAPETATPQNADPTEPKKRGRKRKAVDNLDDLVESRKKRVIEHPLPLEQYEESFFRTNLDEGALLTLEDILASTPPSFYQASAKPTECAKASPAHASPCSSHEPIVFRQVAEGNTSQLSETSTGRSCQGIRQPCPKCTVEPLPEYRTMAEVHPTPRNELDERFGKGMGSIDPRGYCCILSPKFFGCLLCGTDFDFRHDEAVPDYDTTAYDQHAEAHTRRKLALAARKFSPPAIQTSIPQDSELKDTGSLRRKKEPRKSARTIMARGKSALRHVAEHEFAVEIEDKVFKCSVCRWDVVLSLNPLLTDATPWTEHLESAVHQAKEKDWLEKTQA